jgi:hypothetical protein
VKIRVKYLTSAFFNISFTLDKIFSPGGLKSSLEISSQKLVTKIVFNLQAGMSEPHLSHAIESSLRKHTILTKIQVAYFI